MNWPCRVSHSDQSVPSQALCHIAPSVPRPKTSRRVGPQDTAASAPLNWPPSFSQSADVHCEPSHDRW